MGLCRYSWVRLNVGMLVTSLLGIDYCMMAVFRRVIAKLSKV